MAGAFAARRFTHFLYRYHAAFLPQSKCGDIIVAIKYIMKVARSMEDVRELKLKFSYLVILFVFISFLGWCGETLYFLLRWDDFTDRGFLTLPLCTIYGCSIMAIYLIIGTPNRGRLKPLFVRAKKLSPVLRAAAYVGLYILYFVVAALIPTIAEFVTGLFFDKVFGITLWDYGYSDYNLFGYVCLEMSVLWGALITLAMGVVWPLLEKLVLLIPPKAAKKVASAFLILIAADFVFNFSYLLIKKYRFVLF